MLTLILEKAIFFTALDSAILHVLGGGAAPCLPRELMLLVWDHVEKLPADQLVDDG